MSLKNDLDFDFLQPSPAEQPADSPFPFTLPDFGQPIDFSHAPSFESTHPAPIFIEDLVNFGYVPFGDGGTAIAADGAHMQAGTFVRMQDVHAEPPGDQAMVPNADDDPEDNQPGDLFGENDPPDPPDISGEMIEAAIDSLAREMEVSIAEDQSHSAPASAPAATPGISQLDGLQFPTPAPPPVTNTNPSADADTNASTYPQPNIGASTDPGHPAYSSPGQSIAPAVPTHPVASIADTPRPQLPLMPALLKPKKMSPKEVSRNTKARLAAYIALGKWAGAIAAHQARMSSTNVSQDSVSLVEPQPVRAQSSCEPLEHGAAPLGLPLPSSPVVQPAAPAETEHEPESGPMHFCHNCGVQQLTPPLTPRSRKASIHKSYKVTKSVTPPKQKKAAKEKRVFAYEGMKVPQQMEELAIHRDATPGPMQGLVDHLSDLIQRYPDSECNIRRMRYTRANVEEFLSAFDDFVYYERNENFLAVAPYQQEITRIIVDPDTLKPMMETRAALCAYCEDLHFYELRNSCYAQHMSHLHGIHTNNALTPDPLAVGKYMLAKPDHDKRGTVPRPRECDCAVCPECHDLVEIKCWKSTLETKPLANYLRHYKDKHLGEKNKDTLCEESE